MQAYFNRIPSASIVNRIENLRRTVNMGRLGDKQNTFDVNQATQITDLNN